MKKPAKAAEEFDEIEIINDITEDDSTRGDDLHALKCARGLYI